jgi:hypothetical protein
MPARVLLAWLFLLVGSLCSCQSPTNPSDQSSYDDAIDATAAPNPIAADTATGGRTYRIVRGNNQPDEIVPYDWHAVFSMTLSFNSNATDKDIDIAFPVKVTAVTLTVKQASGGIVTPPTGNDKEYFEFVTFNATGNQFAAVGNSNSLMFEVWYDLPSLRKEAIISVTTAFADNDGVTFNKVLDITVAP